MSKQIWLLAAALFIFTSVPVLAAPKTGCNLYKFTGSFTRPRLNEDVLGDGNLHSYVNQLNINADGSLIVVWTAAPDYMINAGTGTPFVGSWTCRPDGKLLVNFIYATFVPFLPAQDPSGQITSQDISLANHFRVSQLWTVDSDNQMTVVQSRTRKYARDEDPTNPTGGVLVGSTSTTTATYTRLIPTDADLLAPPVTP
jgi:hypothetical protein